MAPISRDHFVRLDEWLIEVGAIELGCYSTIHGRATTTSYLINGNIAMVRRGESGVTIYVAADKASLIHDQIEAASAALGIAVPARSALTNPPITCLTRPVLEISHHERDC